MPECYIIQRVSGFSLSEKLVRALQKDEKRASTLGTAKLSQRQVRFKDKANMHLVAELINVIFESDLASTR